MLIFTGIPASDVRSTTRPSRRVSISSRHVGFVKSTCVPSTASSVVPTPVGKGDGAVFVTFGGALGATVGAAAGGAARVTVVVVFGMTVTGGSGRMRVGGRIAGFSTDALRPMKKETPAITVKAGPPDPI